MCWLCSVKLRAKASGVVPTTMREWGTCGALCVMLCVSVLSTLLRGPHITYICVCVTVFVLSGASLAHTAPQSFTLGEALIVLQTSALLSTAIVLQSCGVRVMTRDTDVVICVTIVGGVLLVVACLPLALRLGLGRQPHNNERERVSPTETHTNGNSDGRSGDITHVAADAARYTRNAIIANVLLVVFVLSVLGPFMSLLLGQTSPLWLITYVVSVCVNV